MFSIHRNKGRSFFAVLIAWIIAIILLSTLAISSLVYFQLAELNKSQLLDKYQQSFFQTQNSIQYYLHSMISAATALGSDPELASYIKMANAQTGAAELDIKPKIRKAIINAVNQNPSIQDISIYSGSNIYSYNQENYYQEEQSKIAQEDWLVSLKKSKTLQITVPEYHTTDGKDLYLYACTFAYANPDGGHDVIVISMDGKIYHSLVNNADQKYSSTVCLLDANGKLLYSNNSSSSQKIMASGINLKNVKNGSEQKIASQNYFIVKSVNSDTGWQLVSFVSSSSLQKYFYFIQPNLFLAIVLTVVVSIFLFIFVVLSISKPLKNIVLAMRSTVNSRFEYIDIRSRYVEVQTIVDSYNKMNLDITQYIANLQQTNREKRIVERKLLEAQINPHFIYNTLDAIKWMALINRDTPVAEMLASFVKLLQISLSSGDDFITLKQELEHAQNYINIMKYRYNAQIETEVHTSADVLKLYTLKFIIQPFIENCFFHAFSDEITDSKIILRCDADLTQNCMLIEIEDNGKGMDAEAEIHDPMRRGIGIRNVDERIKLFCGEEFGVQIMPRQPCGTIVQIRQPIRMEGSSTND